jgi:hypothetical protein
MDPKRVEISGSKNLSAKALASPTSRFNSDSLTVLVGLAVSTPVFIIFWKKAIVSEVQILNTVPQDLLGRYNSAVDLVLGDGRRRLGEFVFIAVYRHGGMDFRGGVSNLVLSIVFCTGSSDGRGRIT